MNDKYVLPQAAQDTLGGIKAAVVEDKYTQECRIDKETGKLYTRSADRFLIEEAFEGNPVMSSSCREGNISLIEGYGESTQFTTQGNQLFDISVFEGKSSAGAEATIDNGVVKIIGTPTKDTWIQSNRISIEDFKKYFKVGGLSIKPHRSSGCNFDFGIYINSTTVKENNSPFEITEEIYNNYSGNAYYFIDLKSSSAPSGYIQPMVYQSGTGEYEPYTGAAPSPSPDYPQEIKSPVATAVKVTGKNLFNIEKSEFNNQGNFEITKNTALSNTVICEIQGGGVATISFDKIEIIEPNGGWSVALGFFYADGTNYELYSHQMKSQNNQLSSDVSKSVKSVYVRNPWRVGQKIYGLQIEYGATATKYEPYKEKTIPLSTPITLRGIPSEAGNVTIGDTKYLSDVIDKEKVTRRIGYIASYSGEDVGGLYMSTAGQLTTGATVIYALSEPTTEPLPAEDVQSLADLKTFYPTSIISWETEDGAGVWGKAILKQDMKLYIQNKIKELSNNSVKQIQNINRALLE